MQNIDAVILVGGFGTRIRHLTGPVPKPLATVCGEPFLHWLFLSLKKHNIRKVFLLAHYAADLIEEYILKISDENFSITCVTELIPSGTGGSVVHFVRQAKKLSDPFLLLNGDSLLSDFDLNSAMDKMGNGYDGLIFGVEMNDSSRFGTLEFNENMLLTSFSEKRAQRGVINAGIYLFRPELFLEASHDHIPSSLEKDIIPSFINNGKKFYVAKERKPFIDIGTEVSLNQASEFIKKNFLS